MKQKSCHWMLRQVSSIWFQAIVTFSWSETVSWRHLRSIRLEFIKCFASLVVSPPFLIPLNTIIVCLLCFLKLYRDNNALTLGKTCVAIVVSSFFTVWDVLPCGTIYGRIEANPLPEPKNIGNRWTIGFMIFFYFPSEKCEISEDVNDVAYVIEHLW